MRKPSQHLLSDWASLNPARGKGNTNPSGAPFHMELSPTEGLAPPGHGHHPSPGPLPVSCSLLPPRSWP